MARKYTGNTDGNHGRTRPGTTELIRLATKRFNVSNLGAYTNRRMNNPQADRDPTNPKWLSVHATGRAVDLGYLQRRDGLNLWNFIIANTAALGIEAAHDYAYRWPDQDPKDKTPWGATYRCSRGEGLKGIKIGTAQSNAGTPGGKWLHLELSPAMAADPKAFRAAWIQCLKNAGIK